MQPRRALLPLLLSVVALTACQSMSDSASTAASPSGTLAPASSTTATATATTSAATPARPATVTKLLVFVVENHSRDEMRTEMPKSFRLARTYGYATRYSAIRHPSLPNYLAIAGGSTFGVTNDSSPSAHVLHGRSVFGQAIAAGKTATVYADGMPSNCALSSGGDRYAVKHNPWAYFVDERARCRRHDVPSKALAADAAAGRLPNAGFVAPNLCHDAHDRDCTLADADQWLAGQLKAVLAGPDFASGHLAVVLTADEDDYSQRNVVLTTVIHPSQHQHVVRTPLTHYSLTRLYDQVLGVRLLRNATSAPDMAKAFGLPVAAR